jgi:hypothetical protein
VEFIMLFRMIMIPFVILLAIGCAPAPTIRTVSPTTQTHNLPAIPVVHSHELPADYLTLASLLSMPISADIADFLKPVNHELLIQESIMVLKKLDPADQDLAHIKTLVLENYQNASRTFQKLKVLPRPQDDGSIFLESFIFGALGDIKHGLDLGTQNDQARAAIFQELENLFACDDALDLSNQLLANVAVRLQPRTVVQDTQTVVDFDEAFLQDRYDLCKLYNSGQLRKNCTIVVELTGAQGHSRKNVHFLKEWPANTWVYCPYSAGTHFNGKVRASKTVHTVKTVKVTTYDPSLTTSQVYAYDEAHKAIDIKTHCDGLRFTCKYRPYDAGIILTDERGVFLSLAGDSLPACKVTLTFVKGSQTVAWYWDLTGWTKDETKLFETPKGGMDYDPERVEMTITFNHTKYQHRLTFNFKK